jgi:hypothetical protein
MVPKGIKLDMKDLKQQAAMPLASFLRFDPWTDQLVQMHPSFEPILSQRDKMPFEVEPVYLKLTYYKAPAPPPAAPGNCTAAATPLPALRRPRRLPTLPRPAPATASAANAGAQQATPPTAVTEHYREAGLLTSASYRMVLAPEKI